MNKAIKQISHSQAPISDSSLGSQGDCGRLILIHKSYLRSRGAEIYRLISGLLGFPNQNTPHFWTLFLILPRELTRALRLELII